MVDSHCKIMWADKSGSGLGSHPISNYGVEIYNSEKKAAIAQQRLRSKMIGLWIKNSLTTDDKCKLRDFRSAYTFNIQDDGAAMFFVIIKIVQPDTRAGCSGIKSNLENINMSQLKHDIPKSNLHISEWMKKIPIAGETYLEIVRYKFNLYSTSSCPLFNDHMETSSSEWGEDN